MLRINRTLISFAAALFIAVMLMSARCFAFDYSRITGSTATGANITGYKTAIQVDVTDFGADKTGKNDSYKAIQNALNYAVDNASDSVQLKVVVPKGTYIISKPLKIYSNTWLYMPGATIVRNFTTGFMFRNALQNPAGGYNGDRNIIIEGGCFDGNTNSSPTAFSNVRLGHIRNLWIKDVEFKDNYNGHLLELGGAQNVTIENCTFHEYYGEKEKEAIQLDTMNNENAFVHFEPFDDTACDNIVIRNNKFYDLMRGLGSHSATIGVYYTNVLISGNTFENITDCAMIMQNYKNCLVENNTMTNVGGGIDFKNMSEFEYFNYNPPVAGYDGVYDRISDNTNTIIRNNNISTWVTSYANNPYGIRIYGRKLQGSYYPDYDYKVEGVKISDNKITTAGSAIILTDTKGIQIKSNEIEFNGSGYYYDADLIETKMSSDITIQNNSVTGGNQSAIYVGSSSDVTVKENTCTSSGASGVYVSLSAKNVTVSSNKIKSAGGNGIKVTKEASAEVTENTVEKSASNGILFTGGSGSAKKNTVTGGSKDGIFVEGGVEVTVSGNILSKNKGFGLNVCDNATAYISSNKYEENESGKITVSGGGNAAVSAAKNLAYDGVYEEHVQLSWEGVSEAEAYSVQRRLAGSEEDFQQVAEVFSTSYVDLGLTSRTKYEYRIVGIKTINDVRCEGKNSKSLEIRTKATIADCTTTLPEAMRYTGKAAEPDFSVYVGGDLLTEGVDYKVKFSNNTSVGKATVVITGCGQYCGLKELNFNIEFSAGEIVSLDKTKTTAGSSVENAKYAGSVLSESRAVSESRFGKSQDAGVTVTVSGGKNYIENSLDKLKQQNLVRIQSRRVSGTGVQKNYGLWV